MNALPLYLAGAAAAFLLTRPRRPPGGLEALGQIPITAGTTYLFVVRLSVSDATADAVLGPKGVTALEFQQASVAPPWTKPGEQFSTRVAAFRATPAGHSTVELGQEFYGIGRLEKVVPLSTALPAE